MSDDHSKPGVGKRIGEALILGLYLLIDSLEVWPHHRLIAAIAIPVGVFALLLLDGALSRKRQAQITVFAAVLAGVAYFVVPEDRPTEAEIIGTLQPGAQPDPANRCSKPATPDSWKILIGTSAIQFAEAAEIPLLAIGKCKVLTVAKGRDGLSIAADLFDADGKLIANIKDNTFHALSGNRASIERDNDLSKIIIKDGSGKEMLNVHYLNKSTVRIRGIFGCPGHSLVPVKDNEPIPGVMMNGTCMNFMASVHIGNAFFGVQ